MNGSLDGLWYLAATGRELRVGRPLRRVLFGEPTMLTRCADGTIRAIRDVCPHRGAPLSAGRVCDIAGRPAATCPYHGWAFDLETGACLDAPAVPRSVPVPQSIRVRTFPVAERDGLVWIHRGDGAPEMDSPDLGAWSGARPGTVTVVEASAAYDEAVLGLVDPAHTPVVHRQWWWRDGAPRKDKEKAYEPTALGFRIPPHAPSSNSRIYRIFGGAPTTEIEFRLPGLRIERIRAGGASVLGVTAMTPLDANRTRITHVIYWSAPWMSALTPVVGAMAESFLGQDGAILSLQHENLRQVEHRPLYFGDADEPAKWYFRMKKAWSERAATGGFVNPAPATRLRWRT